MESQYIWSWVGSIGAICSVFGLSVSLYVLSELRRLRADFLLRGTLPLSRQALEVHLGDLSNALKLLFQTREDADIDRQVLIILSKCRGALVNLREKTRGNEKKLVKRSIKSIDRLNEGFSKTGVSETQRILEELVTALGLYAEDAKWRL